MNVLRIIPSMNPKLGGPCQGIRNSIPEMKKMGIENEVVCLDRPDSEYLGKDSFIIHTIGEDVRRPWAYNKDLIKWLLNNFERFDYVIIHGIWLYHSYASMKAFKKFKKNNKKRPKIFIMPHGMLDPYFQTAPERKWKALRNEIYWQFIESKVINSADGILFTCEEELLLARKTFKNYCPRAEINIGYGIQAPKSYSEDLSNALAEKLKNWNRKPYLLFLSRLHPKKGVDLLIKAYLKLEKETTNLPQLVIAGPGLDTDYGKSMLDLASYSKEILFSGMLDGNAKWGAFYECEAFVLTSHQENFGIAIVEALACGKPVLISDKINIWREITKEKGGMIQPDTEEGVYQLLKNWVILSQNEKELFSKSAKGIYEKYFTVEKAAKKMVDSFNNFI